MYLSRLLFCLSIGFGAPALAHEFWIEPTEFQVGAGEDLVANLRNGQNFEGTALAWFDNRFTRFDMISGDDLTPVPGRLGDTPALNTTAPNEGLLVIVHETTPSSLTYTEWEKFLAFADHKDFKTAAADHEANGWSQERFRETYTRHAKALVAVGDGAGSDRAFGLETEFVALTNPYAEGFTGPMRVQVHYRDVPRPDAQVEIFDPGDAGS